MRDNLCALAFRRASNIMAHTTNTGSACTPSSIQPVLSSVILTKNKLKFVRPPETYYQRLDDFCKRLSNNQIPTNNDDMNTNLQRLSRSSQPQTKDAGEDDLPESNSQTKRAAAAHYPVDYILLEGAFTRPLSWSDYRRILHHLPTSRHLVELEIWSDRVPLATLCRVLFSPFTGTVAPSQMTTSTTSGMPCLEKLGMGFLKIAEWEDCHIVERELAERVGYYHPCLKRVYISHFGFLAQVHDDEQRGDQSNKRTTRRNAAQAVIKSAVGSTSLTSMVVNVNHCRHNLISEEDLSAADTADEATGRAETTDPLDSFLRLLVRYCPHLEKVEFRKVVTDTVPWSPDALACLLVDRPSLKYVNLQLVNLQASDLHALSRRLLDRYQGTIHESHQQREPDQPATKHSLSCLQTLDLSENKLTEDGVELFFDVIAFGFPQLKSLFLRGNQLSRRACQHLTRALLRTQQDLQESLPLSAGGEASPVHPPSSGCWHLEKLSLNGNPLGDASAPALAELIAHSSHLKHLELNRVGLTDVGCIQLASALNGTTAAPDFVENQASPRDSSLESLSLFFNHMTDVTYLAFASALTTNSSLKSINLQVERQTDISRTGCQALLDMIRCNYTLESIQTPLSATFGGERRQFSNYIKSYLRLNHAGRKRLLQSGGQEATCKDWVDAVIKVSDDLEAVFYLLRANPMICLLNATNALN